MLQYIFAPPPWIFFKKNNLVLVFVLPLCCVAYCLIVSSTYEPRVAFMLTFIYDVFSIKILDRPLAKLIVLLASQFLLVVLLSTEMFNYWGDEGAEYDKNMKNLEARNLLFFVVAVLMQPVQYDALFGNEGSAWTAFYRIINFTMKKQYQDNQA